MPTEIRLNTPLGEIVRRVQAPEEPLRAAELTPFFYHLSDAVVAQVLDAASDQGLSISCRAGCGACCRQMVPICEPEVFAIAHLVQIMPEERRLRVLERFAQASLRLEEAGLLESLRTPPKDSAELTQLMYDYFEAQIPCPFLEEEGCSIHPERPTICREYNVLSDPELCRDPINNTIRTLLASVHFSNVIARALQKLTGYPTKITALTLALEWVEKRPERGEILFSPAEVIEAFVQSFEEIVGAGEEGEAPPFSV